jgi:hypothetical protein
MKNAQMSSPDKVITPIRRNLGRVVVRDEAIGGALFLLTLLSRLPFRSQILYHWDSVNFAYAMREFNVAKDQPQPPGYILYVGLIRVVDLIWHDPQTTMVSLSIVASALTVVALFYLGRAMFDRQVGLVAALFLASSPLFWFYGEIALPHTLDTLLVVVSVWWLYQVMRGDLRYLYPAVLCVSIAGGIRQQTLIFLLPVLLFALRRVEWRGLLTAALIGGVACLAWFIPLIALNGGLVNYLRIMGDFSRRFQSTTSVFMGAGWSGVQYNLSKLIPYTLYGWSLALLPALIFPLDQRWRRHWRARWEKPVFLTLWVTPSLTFYVFVHMGQQGLIFVYLPALLLLSAVCLRRWWMAHPRLWVAGVSVVVAFNVGIFSLLPEYPFGPNARRFLTRATLVNSDRYYRDRFRAIEEHFNPASTAILALNWHHVEYYLPAYRLLKFSVQGVRESEEQGPGVALEDAAGLTPIEIGLRLEPQDTRVVVLFDPLLDDFNRTPEQVKGLALLNGLQLLKYFEFGPGDELYLGENSFGIVSR